MNLFIARQANAACHIGATLLLLSSCAAPAAEDESSASSPNAWPEVAAIERTLALGMTGDDVAILHRQLTHYGYFPDPELAHDHPAWRPIVAQRPADEREFDEHTLQAVEAFQRSAGLPVTGEVDAATRSQLGARTCGTPDGIEPIDADAKFSVNTVLAKRAFKWRLVSNDDFDLHPLTTAILIANAFQAWANEANLSFTFTSFDDASADFTFQFGFLDAPVNGFNRGFRARTVGNTVIFDMDERWVTTQAPTDGSTDLYAVAAHEIGHLLGVGHSSWPVAVMRHDNLNTRALSIDDRAVISLMYDTWDAIDNTAAVDVATFPQQVDAKTVFFTTSDGKVRTNAVGGFENVPLPSGVRAVRIAMGGEGVPWIVDSQNRVWCRKDIVVGGWTRKPGCLRDVGIDANNRMWGIDCDGRPTFWWASTRCTTDDPNPWRGAPALPGGEVGTSVAVDFSGFPIVVTNTNKIMRRQATDHTGSTPWLEMPVFANAGRAFDVAANADGQVWVVGLDNGFWLHHEQSCITASNGGQFCPPGVINPWDVFPNDNGAPAVKGWGKMIEGAGRRIAAGRDGLVVVGMDARVYRTRN